MNLATPIPLDDPAAAIDLGLGWLRRRLEGEGGHAERESWLAARSRLRAAGVPLALDRMSACFNLAPFEEDLLLLALGVAIDPAIGAAAAGANPWSGAPLVTLPLISRAFLGGRRLPAEAMERLAPDAPLATFALLSGSVEMLLPAAVRDRLLGIDRRDEAIAALVEPLWPVPLPDRMAALAELPDASAVRIVGPAGAGRDALASSWIAGLGYAPWRVELARLSVDLLPLLAREARLDGAGLILTGEGDARGAFARLSAAGLPLAFTGEAPGRELESFPLLRLPVLTAGERAELWLQSRPDLPRQTAEALGERFATEPDRLALIAGTADRSAADLFATLQDHSARELADLVTIVRPARRLDDMVLAPATRGDLEALIAQYAERPRVLRQWGYDRVLGGQTGVSALFAGASGVGKTTAAEAVAEALGMELAIVDLSRTVSKYIGETEKNLARIFDAAEAGGALLFFDEADALFGKRSEVKDAHDRYANQEVAYLLQRMDRHPGVAILATNMKGHLDTAFLRRLKLVVDFPLPDAQERLALWRMALPPGAPQQDIDWAWLSRMELAGGHIVTIAVNAAFRAAAAGGAIGMDALRAAAAAEYRKLDRDPAGMGRT